MKTYEAVFDETKEGVYAISLVDDPAMEEFFIALSKQSVQLKSVDKEQRILMGLVLEPDKLIPRINNGTEFNIVFKADTIKELSHNFFKSGFQKNSKLEHVKPIDGVTIVESWIVEDTKIDKSAAFGLSYPKGSWVATMKVDSDEIWENFVKTGKVRGFSVDAFLGLEEINLKSETMITKQDIVDAIKSGFGFKTEDEVTVETKPEVVEETVEEEVQSISKEDVTEAFADVMTEFNEKIEARFAKMESANEKLTEALTELSKQPASTPVKSAPVSNVELNSKGRLLQLIRENKN